MMSNMVALFPRFHYQGRANADQMFKPSRALQDPRESALFIKKIIAACLCNFVKFRGVFRPDQFVCFTNRDFEVNVLNTAVGRQESYFLGRIQGFFEAIDRKWGETLSLRVISKGVNPNEDSIEVLSFHITYGTVPLVTLSVNGQARCAVQLRTERDFLLSSVTELLDAIFEMGIQLPPLTEANQPHLTIWMKKTSDAPAAWMPPGYPPDIVRGPPLRYPRDDKVVYRNEINAVGVRTGFHTMPTAYRCLEGDFIDSDLFIRYYGLPPDDMDSDDE